MTLDVAAGVHVPFLVERWQQLPLVLSDAVALNGVSQDSARKVDKVIAIVRQRWIRSLLSVVDFVVLFELRIAFILKHSEEQARVLVEPDLIDPY